jgi:DNA-3-methyladenine glycosylase II
VTRGIELAARAPFDLETTVRLLQRRPSNRIDVWEDGSYLRALEVEERLYLCRVRNEGTVEAPKLWLEVSPRASAKAAVELKRVLRWMLRFEDPAEFAAVARIDRKLATVGAALRGARPPRFPSLFETFGRVIPYQQMSLESGGAIAGRLVETFGQRLESTSGAVWAFPRATSIARAREERFAGIGLSRSKIAALKEAARRIAAGALSAERLVAMPPDEALRTLDALPGIGPWSAALLLLRGLGRMEIFPPGDVGAQRGLRALLGAESRIPAVLEALGDRRGHLYFFALGASLLSRGILRGDG